MIEPLNIWTVPRSARRRRAALLIVMSGIFWSLFASGCTTRDDLQLEELKPDLPWDEVLESAQPRKKRAIFSGVPGSSRGAGLPLPPDNLYRIIDVLPPEPEVATKQINTWPLQATAYEGGYYGIRGHTKLFIAPTAKIDTYSRLYWVMVKVLSEKYGCFMVAKQYARNTTRVFCRDKRQIVFWQSRNQEWIQFATRQYDAQGFEIAVRQRRMVRVSPNPVI